ncbi:HAD family hydrolase [Cellulomonas sp. URHD0024]|uniref:HAD family hydrolase n=1 Tax=Cellulomonas sp. URHD0024 TaxID=1302620 RepID=UPI00041763BE|nr:HAD family hydrolase [Cellulomonas sp. URHD0024]
MTLVLDPPLFEHVPDIRLIAVDMDGTLLDDDKQIHDEFWPLLDDLADRGIVLCPASGRQFAALRRQIGRPELVYIAENGAYVVRDDAEVSSETLDLETARSAIHLLRRAVHLDTGTVLCGKRSAYVERTDDAFLAEVHPYYARLELVEDLLGVDDEILKVAVHDFGPVADGAGPLLADFEGAVISGAHWVDVMNPVADKGLALRHVQDALGVTREQTMAFGDYFNDVGLLDASAWSFAMDNAHPTVRAHARFVAPANTANGVVRTIRSVLGLG